jgi:glutamyl/glutaminyl-tRNA synthetase
MHIGGLRTALYSWALAKKHGGDFILRLEDTDQTRKVPEAVRSLLEMFQWVNLAIDEGPSSAELELLEPGLGKDFGFSGAYGPYVQSQRLTRYKEVAEQLVASGHAYRCDMTEEELAAEREAQIKRGEAPGYSGKNRDKNISPDSVHSIRFRMPEQAHIVLDDGIRGRIEWDEIPLKDPVLLKSNGFPSYHLAVVVDDTDMQISHVLPCIS